MFVLLGLAVSFLGHSAQSHAQGNFHIGALEVHPLGGLSETYDSNVYLENSNEKEDWITDVAIGANVSMPLNAQRGEDTKLAATYKVDFLRFADQNELSRTDHRFNGILGAAFANNWAIRFENDFLRTAEPPDNELVGLYKRFYNLFNATVAYNREKIRFENGYSLRTDTYDRLSYLNRNDHRYTGVIFYELYPKTSALLEWNIGRILYKRQTHNSDSKYYQVRIGFEGRYWPKTTGTIKMGYKAAEYDQANKDNFSGFTIFANLRYDISLRTSLNLYAERSSEESSYNTNSYYELNRIGFDIEHLLMQRLTLHFGPYLEYNRYPTETTENGKTDKRRDTITAVGTGLSYEAKDYLTLNLDYDYKVRDSVFETFDYDDHNVSLGARLLF